MHSQDGGLNFRLVTVTPSEGRQYGLSVWGLNFRLVTVPLIGGLAGSRKESMCSRDSP